MAGEDKFITFLQSCIDRLKDGSLSADQKLLVSEFYTKFMFSDANVSETLSEKDMLKYLTVGWYIYNELENNK
jgi:hypothetical protein